MLPLHPRDSSRLLFRDFDLPEKSEERPEISRNPINHTNCTPNEKTLESNRSGLSQPLLFTVVILPRPWSDLKPFRTKPLTQPPELAFLTLPRLVRNVFGFK